MASLRVSAPDLSDVRAAELQKPVAELEKDCTCGRCYVVKQVVGEVCTPDLNTPVTTSDEEEQKEDEESLNYDSEVAQMTASVKSIVACMESTLESMRYARVLAQAGEYFARERSAGGIHSKHYEKMNKLNNISCDMAAEVGAAVDRYCATVLPMLQEVNSRATRKRKAVSGHDECVKKVKKAKKWKDATGRYTVGLVGICSSDDDDDY